MEKLDGLYNITGNASRDIFKLSNGIVETFKGTSYTIVRILPKVVGQAIECTVIAGYIDQFKDEDNTSYNIQSDLPKTNSVLKSGEIKVIQGVIDYIKINNVVGEGFLVIQYQI